MSEVIRVAVEDIETDLRLEGIRLGLEAAAVKIGFHSGFFDWATIEACQETIRAITTDDVLKKGKS